MSERTTSRAEKIWNDYRDLEDQVGNARGVFANILDEDVPDITDVVVRRAIRDRANVGMGLLDAASTSLQGFVDHADDVAMEVDQMQEDLDRAGEGSATTFAQTMLHELNGRLLTDDPNGVMVWILAVLREVGDGPSSRVHGDAVQMVNEAMKWQVAI